MEKLQKKMKSWNEDIEEVEKDLRMLTPYWYLLADLSKLAQFAPLAQLAQLAQMAQLAELVQLLGLG